MTLPVYVPSKGRAGRIPLMNRLPQANVVVAESDFDEYQRHYPGRVLKGQEGVGPNRQSVLNHAWSRGQKRIWMIDDDLTGLYIRDEERMRYGPPQQDWSAVLEQIEAHCAGGPAMVGLSYRHVGWAEPAEAYDRHVGNTLLMYADLPAVYWPHMAEDLDYELQIWTQGFHTLRLAHWAVAIPSVGAGVGGLSDDYRAGKWADAIFALEVRWPGLVRARKGGQWGIRASVDRKGIREGKWAGVRPAGAGND